MRRYSLPPHLDATFNSIFSVKKSNEFCNKHVNKKMSDNKKRRNFIVYKIIYNVCN